MILALSALSATTFADNKTIAIYKQHPIAERECVDALHEIFHNKYKVNIVTHDVLTKDYLKNIDCIIFPGGVGDADNFDNLLADKKNVIRNYVSDGGKYIGICMGSYFAGKNYFDLLGDVDAVQYIKRPNSEVKHERPTVINCYWLGSPYSMYFYDGAAFVGSIRKNQAFLKYQNGDVGGLCKKFNKGRVVVIGPHPEALKSWYTELRKGKLWNEGEIHKLLLNLVNDVLK